MKPAPLLLFSLLAATAVVASFTLVGAQGPGPIADPKSENQAGFPADLYSSVIPSDNPQTPAKIALGPGKHNFRVEKACYKAWTKEMTITVGSELTLDATLEKR